MLEVYQIEWIIYYSRTSAMPFVKHKTCHSYLAKQHTQTWTQKHSALDYQVFVFVFFVASPTILSVFCQLPHLSVVIWKVLHVPLMLFGQQKSLPFKQSSCYSYFANQDTQTWTATKSLLLSSLFLAP